MYKKIFKSIKKNEPYYIKGFFKKSKFKNSIEEIIELSKLSEQKNEFLKGSRYIKSNSNLFINDILSNLTLNPDIIIHDEYRVWNHKKNNITRWHYDGNGIDVINICLNGKKHFILGEPNSQNTFPFTNITMLESDEKKYNYILEPGDLLLIPRFWFHKVISLENDTITLNFCLTNNYDNIPDNYKMLFNLHVFFNTIMSKQYICTFPNLSMGIYDFIIYFIEENIILFVLFYIVRSILKNYLKIQWKVKNNLEKFLLISIFTDYKYHQDTIGMSRLLIITTLINNLLIDNIVY